MPESADENSPDSPRLYLASASPRRRQLLAMLGVRFTVVVSRFDESVLSYLDDPINYVQQAAEAKAAEVATRRAGVILGVDTDVVAPDGSLLGKPTSADDAFRMLRLLSGNTHVVHSGVCVLVSNGSSIVHRDLRRATTQVTFSELTDDALRAYVATGEPLDKAGGYGFQGRALPFIAALNGDPSNVIGLPLTTVAEMLALVKIPLWEFATPAPDSPPLP